MKCSPRFRRSKRYIKAPVSRPSSRRSAVFQKDAFKMQARFGLVCSECFQNESMFSRFTNQTQRMIIPRSVSVRGALQESLRARTACGASHSCQNGTVSFFGILSFLFAQISWIARFAKGWLLTKSPSASLMISVSFFKKSKRISPHSPS